MNDSALPPVPPKAILPGQPVVMPRTGTRVAMPAPRAAAAAPAVRTAFDSAPASTLATRASAERARHELQAAVRAVATAKLSADAAILLGKDSQSAAILEMEGVSIDTMKKFSKAATAIIEAFVLPDAPAETPPPPAA